MRALLDYKNTFTWGKEKTTATFGHKNSVFHPFPIQPPKSLRYLPVSSAAFASLPVCRMQRGPTKVFLLESSMKL
jgi:hypothetical protein